MKEDIGALYDKKLHCNICEHVYSSKKLRSRAIRVAESHNDFYKEYKNPLHNPLLYEVYVCDQCGFASTDNFTAIQKQEIKTRFHEEVTHKWHSQSFDGERTYEKAINTYKLAILTAKKTEQPEIVVAGVCLKLSWLYRYLDDEANTRRFLTYATKAYETSYNIGDFKATEMTELTLMFILGESHRQLGNRDLAITYFSKIIQHKNKHLEPAIVARAREQWQETRQKVESK
ncbi:DUF2225 domain-containing protein [Paenalkalicoccus suaedae]|uniref:DUF2225 domain-containing protein n=1 Tax=Paenalkalicoccus suaedae TaxID=2592382 RepID=A0A859FCU9_9BACI|nr:DUF2225 domain-containing protein [Paenalkalicoccus suaedae]QKS70668.1 DUF2225 domain-containing protein [Paenalkalicoccus suaedae]